jgi:hypothetical protein
MSDVIQLNLFGDTRRKVAEETRLKWSYSRRQALERCARCYYYDYYGSKERFATTDPQKEELRFLSTLSNRYLRTGDILHIAIRLFYKHGDEASKWLVDWARRIYRADYEYSRHRDSARLREERYPPKMLLEFYYNYGDAETLYAESEERLVRNLESFLFNPAYVDIRYAGQQRSAMVEKWIYVKTPVFCARGKVDLVCSWSGKLAIVDWKTGESEALSESLQLAFYALWAVETEGYGPEDIVLYRGYLTDGSLQPMGLNIHTLFRARARIAQDLERIQLLDKYGREAVLEAFPPCDLPKVCTLCAYQCVCPEVTA